MEATQQALDTFELLEAVLLYLPMRDLLLAQRVCKSWHTVITASSPRIRRALFLSEGCGSDAAIDTPGCITSVESDGGNDAPRNDGALRLNPLVLRFDHNDVCGIYHHRDPCTDSTSTVDLTKTLAGIPDAILENTMAHRMFLTQPARGVRLLNIGFVDKSGWLVSLIPHCDDGMVHVQASTLLESVRSKIEGKRKPGWSVRAWLRMTNGELGAASPKRSEDETPSEEEVKPV